MSSIWDPWNFKISNERTTSDVAIQLYQEHFCIATVLEAFIAGEEIEFKDLNHYVFSVAPSDFLDMSVARFNLTLAKMIRLGYLIADLKSEKQKFAITELGVKVWQQQTFQSLAATSFFSYQSQLLNVESHRLNKTSVTLNKSVLILSAFSLIVAILSIFIAVYSLNK
jgi:hypothetical protein